MDGFLIAISIFVLQRVVCLCLGNLRPLIRLRPGGRVVLAPPPFQVLFLFRNWQPVLRPTTMPYRSLLAGVVMSKIRYCTHTTRKNCLTTAVTIEFALLPFAAFGFYIDFGQVHKTTTDCRTQLSGQLTLHAEANVSIMASPI